MESNKPVDFPSIYRDFVKMFPDEASCVAYLERLRWAQGFVCPACQQHHEPWRQTRGRLLCPVCRHQCTVTAGTIFDKTRTPLTTWFDAAWHVTAAKNGMSAKTLERVMGISYHVAWHMLHRFRVAMVRTPRESLSGEVEVDETLIGGVDEGGKRGRGAKKEIVVIALEIQHPKGFGRIRMRHVPDASAESLEAFVRETISPNSIVCTDGWKGYNGLSHGYQHQQILLSSSDDPAHVAMPGVHRIASLLKRWLLDTHQGAFSMEHLQSYLEEFTFRFNRRTSSSRGQLFRRLLEQAVVTQPVTQADTLHGYHKKPQKIEEQTGGAK
jgi:transposase-like protein